MEDLFMSKYFSEFCYDWKQRNGKAGRGGQVQMASFEVGGVQGGLFVGMT